MDAIQREAERRQTTVSEVVEATLRTIGKRASPPTELPPLPEFSSGGLLVDVADRNALYDVMGR